MEMWFLVVISIAAAADELVCPRGARIHVDSLHCYWLDMSPLSWPEAQKVCQKTTGGDLAEVNDSQKVFILKSFASCVNWNLPFIPNAIHEWPQRCSIKPLSNIWIMLSYACLIGTTFSDSSLWVWCKDETHQDPGAAQQGGRSSEPYGLCPQMLLHSQGELRKVSCSRRHVFLCQKKLSASLPSVDTLLIGLVFLSGVYSTVQLPEVSTPDDPGTHRVEMMLFPGLWFSHMGQVASIELVTQLRESHTDAKVQILRPYCRPSQHLIPPGCSSLLNPFSCCSRQPLCNTTGGCISGQYWCHLLESCLPVTSPCSTYDVPLGRRTFPKPPRHPATPPFYHLVADLPLSLPPSSEMIHIRMMLSEQIINVYPDDIIAIQHTAGVGGFLHCPKSSTSRWRQSYLSLRGPEWGGWMEGGLSAVPADAQWVDGVVCDIRVLYADAPHLYSASPTLTLDTTAVSTPTHSLEPSMDIQIVYPLPSDGVIHITVNTSIVIVIKILAGYGATSYWSAPVSRAGVPFQPSCPLALGSQPGCERGLSDAWFSYANLVLADMGSQMMNITVWSRFISKTLSVRLQAHQTLRRLRTQPPGNRRILAGIEQVFSAAVDCGSSVKYTWVIDNLSKFAYEGQTYHVSFEKQGVYKLQVIAENPVSVLSLETTLTVEKMFIMADPAFLIIKDAIEVGALQLFSFRIMVDVSVRVTFWWDFGDNREGVNHTFPAHSESIRAHPEPGIRQVYLQDSVNYSYLQPDDYKLKVQVFNNHERTEKDVWIKVRSPLESLFITSNTSVVIVNQSFELEAHPKPSSYGVHYVWHIVSNGDGRSGLGRKISNVVGMAGKYNVTVNANNTLSALSAWMVLDIEESIAGVHLSYNGPNELGSITTIQGSTSRGTNLRWTFDMDDGSLFENLPDNTISHRYRLAGNYSVKVTVNNAAGHANQLISVEVFEFGIIEIFPLGCSMSGQRIHLYALITGNESKLTFHWNFGDGTPVSSIHGNSTVSHIYSLPGSYEANVTAVSVVGSAFYSKTICIEVCITNLTLNALKKAVAVGEEVCFNAVVKPPLDQIEFIWYNSDLGNTPGNGLSYHCFAFKEEGNFHVWVEAKNKVSNKSATVSITVQKPVEELVVRQSDPYGLMTLNKTYYFWVESCSGSNATVLWDFGDGSPSRNCQNLSHVFNKAGTYRVCVTALNAVSRLSVTLDVNIIAPLSNISLHMNKQFFDVGEEVVLTAVANAMENVSFYWRADSSMPAQLGTFSLTKTFLKAGTYKICVTVENTVSTQEATAVVNVLENIRGVYFASENLISKKYVPTQELILLAASVLRGSNVTFSWKVLQNGNNQSQYQGKYFQLFTEVPGDIFLELTASNLLGNENNSYELRAVERVSGVRVSTTSDVVPAGKPLEVFVHVQSGTDLEILWDVDVGVAQVPLNKPLLRHVFYVPGVSVIRVSVSNPLGSVQAEKLLMVQEEIQGLRFSINGKTHPFFVPSKSSVLFLGNTQKGSSVDWEWTCFFESREFTFMGNQRLLAYSFLEAGIYQVSLNASNDISSQTVSFKVMVEDVVQGFNLNVTSSTVCVDDPIVFTPFISVGTNVRISINIDIVNLSMNLNQESTTLPNLPVGNYTVNAMARNNVSTSVVEMTMRIVEKVHGLRLVNCCSVVLEANKGVTFKAEVQSEFPVVYQWYFSLPGFHSSHVIGAQVVYKPPGSGLLSVQVTASNGYCSTFLRDIVIVQSPIQHVLLISNLSSIFIYQSVSFTAMPYDGSHLQFKWEFGDSLNEVITTDSPSVSHLYALPGSYVVQVTAFNNISKVSKQLQIEIKKLECTRPKVVLIQNQHLMLKSRPSYYEARVDLQGCVSYKASYLWEIFRTPECNDKERVPLPGVDISKPLLILPSNTLAVGSYCLRFTILLQGTPLSQSQNITVTVLHSPMVACIKGGSHRVWSSQADMLLDGTESYDPDAEVENDKPLQYHWSFIVKDAPDSFLLDPADQSKSSTFLMPSKLIRPGAMYFFSLTVQKPGRPPVTTTQSVLVVAKQMLSVSVACMSCSSNLCFSHSLPLVLTGQCLSCNGSLQYKWSAHNCNGDIVELDNITTSKGANSQDLVLKPQMLPLRLNFTFTLNISQPTLMMWGLASITLLLNHPPYGGACTITPESAIYLLQTVVTYNCTGWKDEDEMAQLLYTFKTEVCEEVTKSCHSYILYKGTQDTYGSYVPLGMSTIGKKPSVLMVMVQVEDNLGSTVTALSRQLTVLPFAEGQGAMDLTQSKFWELTQQGNPQEVISYSLALTSQLNQADSTSDKEIQDRIAIRLNVTQALTSLTVSSFQDAVQISSALAQCTAVPRELIWDGCQERLLKTTEKMIAMIGEKATMDEVTTREASRSILQVLGSSMDVVSDSSSTSKSQNLSQHQLSSETAVSALGQVGTLMQSLMRTQMVDKKVLTLTTQRITSTGWRGDPADLLCTSTSKLCHFHIPRSLGTQLRREREEVVQILLDLDGAKTLQMIASPPISTALAGMEFSTPQGDPIPIQDLPPDHAISVMLEGQLTGDGTKYINLALPMEGYLNFSIRAGESHPKAGLFITFNFSLLPGSGYDSRGGVRIMVDNQPYPSRFSYMRETSLLLSDDSPTMEETIFLSPLQNNSGQELFVNLSSSLSGAAVQASVCVFSTLCQYFSVEQRRWRSEGLRPLEGSSPHMAHCLTQHLTMFGASMFVHPDAVVLHFQTQRPVLNIVVGIVCAVLLLLHLITGLIAHKLDHLDNVRMSFVPLCGQPGRYQYRVLVKTGWARGSGTTAHVGISLYGLNKSGSRHLKRRGAFQRNGLDDFHLETDVNLGEIWKIRVWHDNTGLDPSWYLRHVIIWDKQTDNLFFFVVDEWLSVENEKNNGLVEKEVLASCPQELQQFDRILRAHFTYGMLEDHIWVSVWERPPQSTFTRAQRVTCCALLLNLYLAVTAVWYGAVGSKEISGLLSFQILVNAETVAMGMTVALLVFPVQLLFCFLFRRTYSKITVEESTSPTPVFQTVEMDVCLEHSGMGSSFLSLPQGLDSDGASHTTESLASKIESEFWNAPKLNNESGAEQWVSYDSIWDLPELQAEIPLSQARVLKRKKAQLCLASPEHLSQLVLSDQTPTPALRQSFLTFSDEDLIQSIAVDTDKMSGSSSGKVTSDSGRYSSQQNVFSDSRGSSCSGWTQLSQEKPSFGSGLYKSGSSASIFSTASTFLPSPPPDSVGSCSTTHIGVARGNPSWRFPPWVLKVTYLLAGLLLVSCPALVWLYGSSFTSSVLLMWLISVISAFLTSALLLEPLKVAIWALLLAASAKPIDPETEERLEQEPMVQRDQQEHVDKVRAPCGYGLLHAKEEARKVRALRSLMKNCVVHMLFLLVVLLVNYHNSVHDVQIRLLHSTIQRSLHTGSSTITKLSGWAETWRWMEKVLVPYMHQNQYLSLVGLAQLHRAQTQEGCHPDVEDNNKSHYGLYMLDHPFFPHIESNNLEGRITNETFKSYLHRLQCGRASRHEETVELGNSIKATYNLIYKLQRASWSSSMTKTMSIKFTQYQRETNILVFVTITFVHNPAGGVLPSFTAYPFNILPPSLGPDLQIALMVILLLFAVLFLITEVQFMVKDRMQFFYRCPQLLVAILSLAVAGLRLYLIWILGPCLSRLRTQPQTFTDLYAVARLHQVTSQLSAVLLTLLVLKVMGPLRFVRRWVGFRRALQMVWRQLCGIAFLLALSLLIFTHIGYMLFSRSVEGFTTASQTCMNLISTLRGKGAMKRLCEQYPMAGPLYYGALLGTSLCVLGRLCATILTCSYRAVQADMYWPVIEPQDYEMVEFFIKRLKLCMGLSKAKEFRHKVKFEGMVSPPSRSSQNSQISATEVQGPCSHCLASALSLRSEDSVAESYDVQFYLDRLHPTTSTLLLHFDRVNQVLDDLQSIEQKLIQHFSQRQLQQKSRGIVQLRRSVSLSSPVSPASLLPHAHKSTVFTLPWQELRLCKETDQIQGAVDERVRRVSGTDIMSRYISGRRAWYSESSYSAGVIQRPHALASWSSLCIRPQSEEGKAKLVVEHMPVKRRAWHSEVPEHEDELLR